MNEWLTDWLTEWMNEWLTDWLADSVADWLTDWLAGRQASSLYGSGWLLANQMNSWVNKRVSKRIQRKKTSMRKWMKEWRMKKLTKRWNIQLRKYTGSIANNATCAEQCHKLPKTSWIKLMLLFYYTDMSVLPKNRQLVFLIRSYIRDTSEIFSISSPVKIIADVTPLFFLCFSSSFFNRGYAKRRNDYCCWLESANLSLTQKETKSIIQRQTNWYRPSEIMPERFYLLNDVMANAATSNSRCKLTCMTQLLRNSHIL